MKVLSNTNWQVLPVVPSVNSNDISWDNPQ